MKHLFTIILSLLLLTAYGERERNSQFLNRAEAIMNDKVNNYGYSEAYILPTTHEQDKIIEQEFIKHSNKPYNLFLNQCAQVVRNSLKAAGIKVSEETFIYYDSMTSIGSTIKTEPISPNGVFNAIINNNPNDLCIK